MSIAFLRCDSSEANSGLGLGCAAITGRQHHHTDTGVQLLEKLLSRGGLSDATIPKVRKETLRLQQAAPML